MLTYIIRRILLMAPTLLGMLAVVFFVMYFSPGGFQPRQLNPEGAQTTGYDARRVARQQARRYGTNLWPHTQFARWLNRVSPVGFRMSDSVSFSDAQRAAVADELRGVAMAENPRQLDAGVQLALDLAAYTGQPPRAAASTLRDALADPAASVERLLEAADAQLSQEAAAALRTRLARRQAQDLPAAQRELVREVQGELAGVARVRLDQPAFKAPDLGESLRGRPVGEVLAERLPITILLNVLSIPIIYLVAITTGIYAARHRDTSWGWLVDQGLGFVMIALWSVPVIWAGALLLQFLANQQYVRLFPTGGLHDLQADAMPFLPRWSSGAGFERGYLLDATWHLILPVICLTYGGFAVTSKIMRGAMLDNLSADFVRTARAKGVRETDVLWRHTFRNSVLPLITFASSIIPALLGGSVVVETIFSLEGMGKLMVDAAFAKDRDLLMAVTLISGLLVLGSELLRDLLYAAADPRVSYE